MKIVLDPGSTHMGKAAYAKELMDIAEDAGADYIKFQLFPNTKEQKDKGNVHLRHDLFKELWAHSQKKGTKCKLTASVFSSDDLDFLVSFDVPFIKFAYSQQEQKSRIEGCLQSGRTVVVSTDDMGLTNLKEHPNLVKLFCSPLYPDRHKIDFEEMFPPFDGFSDHTRGIGQTLEAAAHGAEWIEKHITLEYSDVVCPDRAFALTAKQVKRMVKELRAIR